MEVIGTMLVSWFIAYLRTLQPNTVYKGVVIHLPSTMDIPVLWFLEFEVNENSGLRPE